MTLGKKIVEEFLAQDPAKSEEMVELSIFIDNHLDNALKAQREACLKALADLDIDIKFLDDYAIQEAILNAEIEE